MSQLNKYSPGRDVDLLVAQWWARMDADGDLDRLFGTPAFPLGDLFVAIRAPHELLYAADADGLWFAVLFDPFMSGAYLSAWIRPDRRASVGAAGLFLRCLRAGASAYGTILNVTWQEELLPVHAALGYTFVGRIPKLLSGHDALIFAYEGAKQWPISQHLPVVEAQPVEQPVRQVPLAERPAQPVVPVPLQQPQAPLPNSLAPLVLAVLQRG